MGLLKKNLNAGNLLVIVGVIALVATLAVPSATARRVARIEGRAAEHAAALLDAARAAPDAPLTADALLAALPPSVRERLEPAPPLHDADGQPVGICFTSKHYCFLVTRAPGEEGEGVGPREVYAWPRGNLATGRTVFRFAEGAEPVFTRNLQAGYIGFEHPPSPGAAQPRQTLPEPSHGQRQLSYRGRDDERWLGWPHDRS